MINISFKITSNLFIIECVLISLQFEFSLNNTILSSERTLGSLHPGQSAYVSVLNENFYTCKLMNLGILPKTKVTMVRKSPFGGAYYVKIGNYQMAMREDEASTIFIQEIL